MNNNNELVSLQQTIEELRQSFDQGFCAAPAIQSVDTIQVLIFDLAHERYAIPLEYIQEVIVNPLITIIPGAPAVIAGIINLRGEIISVSSIHPLFELKSPALADIAQLIIIKGLRYNTAIAVDLIRCTAFVEESKLQPALSTLATDKAELLMGSFRHDGHLVVFLHMEKLIEAPEMQIE